MAVRNPIVKAIYDVLLYTGFEGSLIKDVEYEEKEEILRVVLKLPPHADREDFEEMVLNNLKEELEALDVKVMDSFGKQLEVWFSMKELGPVEVRRENVKEFLQEGTLKIPLVSSFGMTYLDFEDGASCHMLNGGTTRMGKTFLLIDMAAMLYLQTKGEMHLYIISPKIKDFYPFDGLPGVVLSKTHEDFKSVLDDIIEEYKQRDYLINTPTLRKATDAKSVRKHYPEMFKHFKPVFLFIDEYARFSDDQEIQKKVMELVETAGYVNVHVIVATQRPDARTVLPARIKANLLARICFTTTDKNNSIVILDDEGAEKLGRVPGRAIYLDGHYHIIQVPFFENDTIDELLEPFRRSGESGKDASSKAKGGSGCSNQTLADKIQGVFAKSVGPYGIQEEHQPGECSEPGVKENVSGWFRLADKEGEG